jgi:pSer/pThr/pTyr-binding forkhead associated (FHA) protein
VSESEKKPEASSSGASSPPATSAESAAAEAPPPEEKTQPYRLKPLVEKMAKQRRRTTAAELLVKRPRQPEVRVPLDRTETYIGRDPKCDIVLTDDSASRRHARIARNAGGYFEIVDLGSKNGILVQDERVDRMTLMDGDVFLIGETQFSIVVGPLLGSEGN